MGVQDMNVLHQQERKLAKKPHGWRDYYLATQSDTGVASFWRWLDTFAGVSKAPVALNDPSVVCNSPRPEVRECFCWKLKLTLSSSLGMSLGMTILIQTAWAIACPVSTVLGKGDDASVQAQDVEKFFLVCRW